MMQVAASFHHLRRRLRSQPKSLPKKLQFPARFGAGAWWLDSICFWSTLSSHFLPRLAGQLPLVSLIGCAAAVLRAPLV
jgi:hypothetical protein